MKILLIRIDRLGDLIQTLPAINAIKENYPLAEIDCITNKAYNAFLKQTRLVNNVLPLSFSLLTKLRRTEYDYAIDLTPASTYYSSLLLSLSHAKEKVGYNVGIRKYIVTKPIYPQEIMYEKDMVLEICRQMGIPILNRPLIFPVKEKEKITKRCNGLIKEIKKKKNLIAVHITASSVDKIWSLKNFIILINKMIQEEKGFVFIGTKQDQQTIEYVNSRLIEKQSIIAGLLSIEEMGVFLSKCDLLLCNNSGPMNIGAAVGVPMVVLNFVSSPLRWCPKNKKVIILSSTHEDLEILNMRKSKREISVEEVYDVCNKIFK